MLLTQTTLLFTKDSSKEWVHSCLILHRRATLHDPTFYKLIRQAIIHLHIWRILTIPIYQPGLFQEMLLLPWLTTQITIKMDLSLLFLINLHKWSRVLFNKMEEVASLTLAIQCFLPKNQLFCQIRPIVGLLEWVSPISSIIIIIFYQKIPILSLLLKLSMRVLCKNALETQNSLKVIFLKQSKEAQ